MVLAAAVAVALAGCVSAPQSHPAYLHALEDLRSARWMVEHLPGDLVRSIHEVDAARQIDWAIYEINKAAIHDGKNVDWHPVVDERTDHVGRLQEALRYLQEAHAEVARDEDNFFATGLRNRAIVGIDAAIKATNSAISD
jgi:hypothetical protein